MPVNSRNDIPNIHRVKTALLSKCEIVTESGCWLWTGALNENGYGRIALHGPRKATNYAHRISYILFVGDIPRHLLVRHKCDVPSCVNPAHLEIGTHQQNANDSVKRNRRAKGEKHGISVLNKEQVMQIVSSPLSGPKLSKEIGVSSTTINRIRSGRAWNHLTKIRSAA